MRAKALPETNIFVRGRGNLATENPVIRRIDGIDDLRYLRPLVLLDEPVPDQGLRRVAADLDVDHRILTASLEGGRMTRRMRVALARALLARGWNAGRRPGRPCNGGKDCAGCCGC